MIRGVKVLLVLLMLLISCAQKPAPPAETASAPAAAPAAPQDDRPVILALGDSITAGFGVDVGSGWPELLQQLLDSAGYKYRVVNAGVSGDTSAGGLSRLEALLALKPRVLILELGGNDGLRGTPASSTRANLEEIIVTSRKAGATVLLAGMTLPGNYGPQYIAEFEKMYADLAAKHKLTLIPFRLESIGGAKGSEGLMQRDGLHPSVEGHRRLAPHVLKHLEPVLEK
jgi:acyl-CoA thioesterase-1